MAVPWWLLTAAVIGLVVSMVRSPVRREEADSPLEVLATRYARGDIDRDEYLERQKDLG